MLCVEFSSRVQEKPTSCWRCLSHAPSPYFCIMNGRGVKVAPSIFRGVTFRHFGHAHQAINSPNAFTARFSFVWACFVRRVMGALHRMQRWLLRRLTRHDLRPTVSVVV